MLPDKGPEVLGAGGAGLLNGRYELGEKVGEGSFFVVHRGRDVSTGRVVAIKLLSDEYSVDREFAERLREESLRAARLDHPHIVPVYDAWIEDGRVAIATEFVRGINLKDRIRRVAPFPLAVAIDIAAAVSEALEYATSLGLSHGDLRPENVLVTPEGQVKLADFGVGAAVCASSRLQMSALLHSAHYLPPEVAQGKPPSAPSDVYALGAILFEMLSGQPPFQADTPFAIAVKHLHDPPPSLRRLNAGAPKAVEGIVNKCLLKEPETRYPDTAALLADLRSVREALRYGRPLSWSPPIEAPPATARAAASAPRATSPPRAQPKPAVATAGPPSDEPSTRLLVVLPLMALVLAAAVFGLFVYSTRAPKDTIVPKIRGMTRSEAESTLALQGLTLRVVQERFDEKVAPGTVLLTNPPEGTQVKQERAVEVWISKGPQPILVPTLLETQEQDARARIKEAGLSIGAVRSEYDETVPKGTVISQDPPAGTEARKRSSVSLVISRGPESLPPPEPDTAPDSIPPLDSSDDGTIPDAGTDSTPDETTTDGGTLTVPLDGGTDSTTTEQPEVDKNRVFDVSTKIEGQRGWSRIRIVLTDDNGRREVVNDLYRRGQTVRKTVKATGEPGSVRIEVYENRKLVKDERH